MGGSTVDWLEVVPKIVSAVGGLVGMVGGVMGIVSSRSIRKREQWAQQENDEMWNAYVNFIETTNSGKGNAWTPTLGSKEHKMAEKMVERGWLQRGPLNGYMLRMTGDAGRPGLYPRGLY